VTNAELLNLTGKSPEWFLRRTGIHSRSRAEQSESASSMAIKAVEHLTTTVSFRPEAIDLVLAGSYTPDDTLTTIAHRVQRAFSLSNANALYVSTACSSFISLLELAQMYIDTGKASNVLCVTTEHNSRFSCDSNPASGHLWGDAASACLVQREMTHDSVLCLRDVLVNGLGHIGSGSEALRLDIKQHEIIMDNGREVFELACREMAKCVRDILSRNELETNEIGALIAHQANGRILDNVRRSLGLELDKCPNTVEELGNTGSSSIPITLAKWLDNSPTNKPVVCVSFGGGYSSGAALLGKP